MQPAPVFILAPPRSCTSVICAMLGQHPGLHALPEVNLLAAETVAELLDLFERRPGLGHGLLRAVAELGLGGQTDGNVDLAHIWLREHRKLGVDSLYGDLTAFAARRLVDKSPLHVLREDALGRMREYFPDADYLHLVREPGAVCRSYFRFRERLQKLAGGRGRQGPRLVDLDEPDQVWLAPHKRILDHLDQVPAEHRFLVRAEDVLADPARQLGDIAGWLGLASGPEEIEAMLHPENSPYAGPGPSTARFGNDPEFLRSPALRAPSTRKPDSHDDFTPSDATRALAMQLGYPG